MFGSLIESIRTEAASRGQTSQHSTPGEKKTAKKGRTRYIRQQSKKNLKGYQPGDNVNLPTRGTAGYAD